MATSTKPVADDPEGLNIQQRRFAEEYVKDLNATQAAIRAGYTKKNADVVGPKLLDHVGVSRAIAKRQAALTAQVGLTQVGILTEVAAMAHSDVTHYVFDEEKFRLVLAEGAPPNAMRAVSGIKYRVRRDSEGGVERSCEFKLWDKPGMVRLGGRHVGVKGFSDRVEIANPDGTAIAARVVNVFTGLAPPPPGEEEEG